MPAATRTTAHCCVYPTALPSITPLRDFRPAASLSAYSTAWVALAALKVLHQNLYSMELAPNSVFNPTTRVGGHVPPVGPPMFLLHLCLQPALPVLAAACPSTAHLSLYSRRVSLASPCTLCNRCMDHCAPTVIPSHMLSALLALVSHPFLVGLRSCCSCFSRSSSCPPEYLAPTSNSANRAVSASPLSPTDAKNPAKHSRR